MGKIDRFLKNVPTRKPCRDDKECLVLLLAVKCLSNVAYIPVEFSSERKWNCKLVIKT